jgi:hypothetical protein
LLTYERRHVGDITVVMCRGPIAEGRDLAALQQEVDDVLPETPYIVADLGAVDFIDSSGMHAKAQRARPSDLLPAPVGPAASSNKRP